MLNEIEISEYDFFLSCKSQTKSLNEETLDSPTEIGKMSGW